MIPFFAMRLEEAMPARCRLEETRKQDRSAPTSAAATRWAGRSTLSVNRLPRNKSKIKAATAIVYIIEQLFRSGPTPLTVGHCGANDLTTGRYSPDGCRCGRHSGMHTGRSDHYDQHPDNAIEIYQHGAGRNLNSLLATSAAYILASLLCIADDAL